MSDTGTVELLNGGASITIKQMVHRLNYIRFTVYGLRVSSSDCLSSYGDARTETWGPEVREIGNC